MTNSINLISFTPTPPCPQCEPQTAQKQSPINEDLQKQIDQPKEQNQDQSKQIDKLIEQNKDQQKEIDEAKNVTQENG
ncbi:hypothetical protein [Mycolicibacterium nivoides]|uniref:hypothetical protein n=1 Tax=Mycolicibacterium nivoides TaxID=2487344 RepID=UPI003C2FB5FC